jgi:DNA polymerase-3 subunit epsilon
LPTAVHDHWILPRSQRRVPGPIRELTGWSEACLAEAVQEHDAWQAMRQDRARLVSVPPHPGVPTVIHYARFELPFLRDLHERLGDGGALPFDTICLHAIAARLFPDLPRRNIRALAGFLGHSTGLLRRSAGHVAASAFIWREVVPLLEQAGVPSWDALKDWLADAPRVVRSARRIYPLERERRRALPDRPGVYRFVRRNRDLLYVGKAASLRKRVASHFAGRGRVTERGLELLTQVHDIDFTETASVLEAALLESDEIKRLDPPYNVQLRTGERSAWFASRDLTQAQQAPDAEHRVGPLPSERALSSLGALILLADGAEATPLLRAIALAVPIAFLPDDTLFEEGYRAFAAEHLSRREAGAARCVTQASLALWTLRGRTEIESAEDRPPELWDLARVRRRLERALVQCGLLMRRSRWLCLLADADIAFREAARPSARALVMSGGQVVARHDLEHVGALPQLPVRRPRPRMERLALFDAAAYDRLRVLATELRRVHDEAGELTLRFGAHVFTGERLAKLISAV